MEFTSSEVRTLIDELLEEQQGLTAVEEFSHAHDKGLISAPKFSTSLPVTLLPGTQFAFEVDLDKCSGCKACVTACHSLNGLDEDEAWREVRSIISDTRRNPARKFVTTSCHHCLDPACLLGCPVLAYDKNPETGIVRHLDDQCIGCQYCVMMCPYDVPKYSESRGIVRKCDMCSQRLGAGEAPTCVQACPNEAIKITLVSVENLRNEITCDKTSNAPHAFPPGSPPRDLTLPTTRFISKEPLPATMVSESGALSLQSAHWPLVIMLVMTQLGVGCFALLPLVSPRASIALAEIGCTSVLVGIVSSVAHLGRPLKAWRSFLGLRTSWLSREIVAFALVMPLAGLLMVAPRGNRRDLLGFATVVIGLFAVFSSGMVYRKTRRVFWSNSISRFFASTFLLGAAAAWLIEIRFKKFGAPALSVALLTSIKLAIESRFIRNAGEERPWPEARDFDTWSLAQTATILWEKLGVLTRTRFLFGMFGGIVLPLLSFVAEFPLPFLALIGFAFCLAGEFIERYTFFRAVVPPRMP
jgi:formate dehydrogenase iron-sulfur subunit